MLTLSRSRRKVTKYLTVVHWPDAPGMGSVLWHFPRALDLCGQDLWRPGFRGAQQTEEWQMSSMAMRGAEFFATTNVVGKRDARVQGVPIRPILAVTAWA